MKNEIEYYIGNKVLLNWNEYGFSINPRVYINEPCIIIEKYDEKYSYRYRYILKLKKTGEILIMTSDSIKPDDTLYRKLKRILYETKE
jgi:hypothetical protein